MTAAMTLTTARSPFLHFDSFSAEEVAPTSTSQGTPASSRSPFLSIYEADEAIGAHDTPMREAFAALVGELHDDEFDEALHELECSARAMHRSALEAGTSRAEADRAVGQHLSRLTLASEQAIGALANEFAPRERGGIMDAEIDQWLEAYTPPADATPEFEQFLGKLVRKVGRAAKAAAGKAWQGIRKVALGPFFKQIQFILRPLMNGVLQRAIGRLPADVQPAARRLAQKLGFAAAPAAPAAPAGAPGGPPDATTAEPAAPGGASPAGVPVQAAPGDAAPSPQQEFNEQIASALLAQDELELQMEAAQQLETVSRASSPAFAELEDARERFIADLQSLAPEQDATPLVQNFLPAVLPAIKLGIRFFGRGRLINLVSPLLAKLIAGMSGPESAPALSRAIVDAGLKLMNLEMDESEAGNLAAPALAATLEETITRIASLPDEVLDNEDLLEGYAVEAFEQAAAANLPAMLSQDTYRRRPELLEGGLNAGWVLLPLRGPKRYKRCTRSFRVALAPHIASEVESFEGATLAEHLQEQFGVEEGETVDAELHLFEALPGTTLADIAHGERATLGSGLTDEANVEQFHPLTPRAAGVLLGRPGLGRAFPAWRPWMPLPAGLRLYAANTGRRALLASDQSRRLRRMLRVSVVLDGVQDQVRLCVYVSEARAQRLALRLREAGIGGSVAALASGLQRSLARRLDVIFRGLAPARLRVIHAAMRPGTLASAALAQVPPAALQAFVARLQGSAVQAFAEFAKTQAQRIATAAADPADGMTLVFALERTPGLNLLCRALAGDATAAAGLAAAVASGGTPTTRVDVHAGLRCG